MTIDISDNSPRIEYSVASGITQTVFAVPFEFFEDSDVYVYVDGSLKAEGTDYTLTGGGGSTGTLTFVTATPPDEQQVTGRAGGTIVSLVRHVALERVTDFVAGQGINRAALNEQLDTIVAQVADLDSKVDRTIHLSDYEVAPSMLLTEDRKGRTLAFNATTGAVEAGPLSNDVTTVANNITEILDAPSQAAAAATSAASASTSASVASTSASEAASSATSASASETAAEIAKTNAETAESNASASETNAATSETNAATSATEAETAKTETETARDAALAALDSFDDRYLGVKTSDPTVDNDGDALVVGALYFNSNTDLLYVYNGSSWQVTTSGASSGDLVSTNNLSDLTSAATARTNLGLGTAATTASTDYATAAQGALADTATQPADLGTAAAADTGDFATAAQGTLADSAVQPNDSPTFGTVNATSFSGDGSALTGLPAGYTNADVDTHLNYSTAITGQVLSFSGSDYDWVDAGAGAGGGGSDEIFWENGQNVTANYTITNGKNAMSAGPITIDSGVTVTVGAGETWTVI